jgi:nucleotide-binding universal stress UspA family protein
LLVLGTHGGHEQPGTVLGSVAYAVAVHGQCPTVIVRGDAGRVLGPTHPVVVGIDGSQGSKEALRFAAEKADSGSAPLVIVTVYPSMTTDPWTNGGQTFGDVDLRTVAEFDLWSRRAAQAIADRAAESARAMCPGLDVDVRVIAGSPGRALIDETRSAALLVLGSHGWGGVVGMLGSATHRSIHRAACPVVVVPMFSVPRPFGDG